MKLVDKEGFALRTLSTRLLGRMLSVAAFCSLTAGDAPPIGGQQTVVLVDGALTEAGSAPFHLKAELTDGGDPLATLEEYWMAPDRLRRTIKSQGFSQTLIVDGDRVSDQHAGDYMPIAVEQLIGALLDPRPLLAYYTPGDPQTTKANGRASESGVVCTSGAISMCRMGAPGLREQVQILGHYFAFSDFKKFEGKRIAQTIMRSAAGGDNQTARITTLELLEPVDEGLFKVDAPTPASSRFDTQVLPEDDLRSLATDKPDLIWPQVLDGAQTGPASFYVGIDPSGRVREVFPVATANERANDSADNMISRWKFKPAFHDGVPVQTEGLLSFTLNTRAYGPAEPLSDAEVRKLAANIVDPVVASGTVPPGTEFKILIAVDADGSVIEKIIAGGPSSLFRPVDGALHQWHFRPIMENGQPRPYRGLLVFKF